MSIGGAFHAFDRYRLRALVIDPSSVAGFLLHTPPDKGGPHARQTVEQAWDVVRVLLPEAVDGEQLEGTEGLGCIYLTASHVERAAARLARRSVPEVLARFTGEPAQFAQLYCAQAWQNAAQELAHVLEGVKRFFAEAAARRDAVVFYIA